MVADAIEREIFIEAGIERVWSLVSRTGFWIGNELHFEHEGKEGETIEVVTEEYGTFPVLVERLEPPRYAAYRWVCTGPDVAPAPGLATLVEFTLDERDGGVVVRLRESGFQSLTVSEETLLANYRENEQGWDAQLERLRVAAEGVAVG